MIIDHRVYAMLYALIVIAWAGGFLMIGRAKPGSADVGLKMAQANRYLVAVAVIAVAVAFANYADWLWS